MNKLAPEELKALGLAPDMEFELVEQEPAPERPVALGKAGTAQADVPLQRVRDLLREQPYVSPVSLKCWQEIAPDTSLHRWDLRPEIAVFHHGGQRRFACSGDRLDLDESTMLLDSRWRPACLRLDQGDVAWLLRFEVGDITLSRSHPRAQPERAATWTPAEPPEVPVPEVGTWLERSPGDSWLLEASEQLADEAWNLARVAAAGLVARLWSPPIHASRSERAHYLSPDFEGPAHLATAWFSALPTDTRESVERSALFEVGALQERLQELEDVAMEDPEQAEVLGRSWLHRRDDLQGVLFLLKRAGTGDVLEEGLRSLDAQASEFPSYWALLELEGDERLRAVSWQEPDAWWGRLARA